MRKRLRSHVWLELSDESLRLSADTGRLAFRHRGLEKPSEAGFTPPLSGSVERGERNISVVTILRLAQALDLDPGTLVSGLEHPQTSLPNSTHGRERGRARHRKHRYSHGPQAAPGAGCPRRICSVPPLTTSRSRVAEVNRPARPSGAVFPPVVYVTPPCQDLVRYRVAPDH